MTGEDFKALSALCPDPKNFAEWVRIQKVLTKTDSLTLQLPSGSYDADAIIKMMEKVDAS